MKSRSGLCLLLVQHEDVRGFWSGSRTHTVFVSCCRVDFLLLCFTFTFLTSTYLVLPVV